MKLSVPLLCFVLFTYNVCCSQVRVKHLHSKHWYGNVRDIHFEKMDTLVLYNNRDSINGYANFILWAHTQRKKYYFDFRDISIVGINDYSYGRIYRWKITNDKWGSYLLVKRKHFKQLYRIQPYYQNDTLYKMVLHKHKILTVYNVQAY